MFSQQINPFLLQVNYEKSFDRILFDFLDHDLLSDKAAELAIIRLKNHWDRQPNTSVRNDLFSDSVLFIDDKII